MKTKLTKRQLIVLTGACLFQLALLGTLANCVGTLTAHMRAQFGISMTQISLYNTVRSVTSALLASVLTRAFHSVRKPAFMIANNLTLILSFLMLIPGGNVWLFFMGAILHGSTFSVSAIMIVDALEKWFPDNLGFATGLTMMFSGLGGAVFNPLIAVLLEKLGWSAAISIVSIITLVLTLAGVALIFSQREPPQEREMSKIATRTSSRDARGISDIKLFLLCCAAILGGAAALQFNNYIAIFAQSEGYSLTVGATMASMAMVGNVAGKLAFGVGCDKTGIWKTMRMALLCIVAALSCFLLMPNRLVIMYLACVLFGIVFALFMMSICQFCDKVFAKSNVSKQVGRLTGVNNLLNAMASLGIGAIYDSTAAFANAIYVIITACAISIVATIKLEKYARSNELGGYNHG